MNALAARYGTPVLGLLALAVLAMAAVWPVGLKVIDEAIYYAAAWSLAHHGSLTVANGWSEFGAEALRLRFMTPGPNGLAPQYPPGSALLAAPLMHPFGMRGMVLVNAAAAAATLFATRALGRAAFGREDIALGAALLLALASFWPEYVAAIWPHALSTLAVTVALWALFRGLAASGAAALRWAALSGLVAGAGILVRTDTALVLPALAAATILFADRHLLMLLAGAAGTLPGLAVGSAVNIVKFGTWNPLSYGVAEGGVALSGHAEAAVAVLLALNALLLIRRAGWRPARRGIWLAAAGAGAVVLAIPAGREIAWSWLIGAWRLIGDARLLTGPEIQDRAGIRYFWGVPKKALGQSMPWIGLVLLATTLPLRGAAARAAAILLIAFVIWTLPFALLSWYGGYGANMRYFLPMLPVLAVLGAGLWAECARRTGAGAAPLALGLGGGGALLVGWYMLHPAGYGGTQQMLPLYILAATGGTALLAGLAARRTAFPLHVTQVLAAMGFLTAGAMTLADLRIDHWSRNLIATAVDRLKPRIPPRSLIYGRPELFPFQLARPEGLMALPAFTDRRDARLLARAMAAGYRVFADVDEAERLLRLGVPFMPEGPLLGHPESPFIEIVPVPGGTGNQGDTR